MESYLGAGALCQICFDPLGQLEDLKAPYVIACGHVFCLGCMNNDDSCCGICGVAFDRQPYSRLLALSGQSLLRTSIPSSFEQLGQQLKDSIARVNPHTSISHIRPLYDRAWGFLSLQPRNYFQELETSTRLLGYLLQAKEALKAHGQLMNVLTERALRLNSEKLELQARLEDLECRQAYEHAEAMDNLPNLMRTDPNFDLLTDEVLIFRKEMNDLTKSVHDLRDQYYSVSAPATNPFPPSPHFTPKIRVNPPSRSPSLSPSPPNDAYNLSAFPRYLSPLELYHPDTAPDIGSLPNLDLSTASDSSESPDRPLSVGLPDSDSDSDNGDHTTRDIHILSGISFNDALGPGVQANTLRQSGYAPSNVIHQPQAIYPRPNLVRFDVDAEPVTSPRPESNNPEVVSGTPGSDVDSVMAMSISSLSILKTPIDFKERVANFVETLERDQQINSAPVPGEELSEPVAPPMRLTPSRLFSNGNLNEIIIEARRGGSSTAKSTNSIGSRSPTRLLSSTAGSIRHGRGPSTTKRAVTRSKSFPNLLPKRTAVSNDIRPDGVPGNGRLVAEMRSCLIEVVARVFVHLMADGNGQVPSPSAVLSGTRAAASYAGLGLDLALAQTSISEIAGALEDRPASSDLYPSAPSGLDIATNVNPSFLPSSPSPLQRFCQTPS